jgi:hypothetical protein
MEFLRMTGISIQNFIFLQVKVKLSLALTQNQAMQMYYGGA